MVPPSSEELCKDVTVVGIVLRALYVARHTIKKEAPAPNTGIVENLLKAVDVTLGNLIVVSSLVVGQSTDAIATEMEVKRLLNLK